MSKVKLSNRWHREGRLEEVRAWMDDERARLRGTGMSRSDARDEVWRLADKEFPPVDESEIAVAVRSSVPPPENLEQSFDVVGDVKWVHEHLADSAAVPHTAGAYGMLCWARTDPNRFYQILASKLLISEARASKEYTPTKQERREVDKLRDTYEAVVKEGLLMGRLTVKCPRCATSFQPMGEAL